MCLSRSCDPLVMWLQCSMVIIKTTGLNKIIQFWTCVRYPAAGAKSLQSCPTLCDRIDGSPPGSPVPGILQARTLEWVAISFSSAWKWKVKGKSLSCVRPSATPWTAAFQAPPSMGFSRQEYWSGVPLPSLVRCPAKIYIGCHRILIWWSLLMNSVLQKILWETLSGRAVTPSLCGQKLRKPWYLSVYPHQVPMELAEYTPILRNGLPW